MSSTTEASSILVDKAIKYRTRGVYEHHDQRARGRTPWAKPEIVAQYEDLFARARRGGLKCTVHQRDNGHGRQGVMSVVEKLKGTIGHGIRAAYADERDEGAARERHRLELCPTSNLHQGGGGVEERATSSAPSGTAGEVHHQHGRPLPARDGHAPPNRAGGELHGILTPEQGGPDPGLGATVVASSRAEHAHVRTDSLAPLQFSAGSTSWASPACQLGHFQGLCRSMRRAHPRGRTDAMAVEVAGLPSRWPWPRAWTQNAEAVDGLFACGFSAVEIGTITPSPARQPALPRLFRLEHQTIINRRASTTTALRRGRGHLRERDWHPARWASNGGQEQGHARWSRRLDDYVACVDARAPGRLQWWSTPACSTPGTAAQEPEQLSALWAPCRSGSPPWLGAESPSSSRLPRPDARAVDEVVDVARARNSPGSSPPTPRWRVRSSIRWRRRPEACPAAVRERRHPARVPALGGALPSSAWAASSAEDVYGARCVRGCGSARASSTGAGMVRRILPAHQPVLARGRLHPRHPGHWRGAPGPHASWRLKEETPGCALRASRRSGPLPRHGAMGAAELKK